MSKVEEIIQSCANGDKDAKDWLVALYRFCHAIDDAIDEPEKLDQETLGEIIVQWTLAISSNPFFRRYHDRLEPLFEAAVAAWICSFLSESIHAATAASNKGSRRSW